MMPKPFLLSRPVPAAVFILAAVILDQVLKYLVEIRLPLQQAVPLIPHLALYRTWNEGVAFSFLSGMSAWTIVGMRFVIVAFILWWWSNARQAAGLVHLGFAMIVAGAIGNIIDRFIYGHVVDYILFYTETWSFAVFNLADSLITTGAVVVGFSEFFLRRNGTKDAN